MNIPFIESSFDVCYTQKKESEFDDREIDRFEENIEDDEEVEENVEDEE